MMYLVNVFISSVLTLISVIIVDMNVSNLKLKLSIDFKKIIFIILSILMFFINTILFKDFNKVLFNIFIIIFINSAILFEFDYKKSVYYTLLFYFYCCLAEIISSILVIGIFNFNKDIYNTFTFSMTIFSILNLLIIYALTKIKILTKFFEIFYKKLNKKTYIFMIFIMAYIILICFNNKENLGSNKTFYINVGLFIFILSSVIIVINNTYKRLKYESEYDVLQRNLSMYEKEVNRQGKKNHEYNNQLMVLKGYVNNPKKLNEYLDLLIEEHKGGQNFRIKQLGYLPDGGFKGLLYNKLAVMEDNNIKSYLYVSSDLKKFLEDIDVKYYSDLTKIFGIFVDNAIDATKEAKKKEIVIDLKTDDEYLVIEISNTYNKNIDIKKIGKKGYTSKGIDHGFGLSIVKDIKSSSDLIDTFNDIENDMFKQTIMAKIK